MRGMGRVYKRGPIWWVQYSHRARKFRESSRSPERADAVGLLKRRIAELGNGKPSGPDEERVTF